MIPDCESGVLLERALVAERDHSLELLSSTITELASVDPSQHSTCGHEVPYQVRQDELGAMRACPLDETVEIDSLNRAAAAGSHDE